MKNRYIICINNSTEQQEKKFIEYIKSYGLGWWHWLNNTLLLTDPKGKLNAGMIRDSLRDIFPDENILVIEINATKDTWSGFGPNTEEKNMFTWLKKHWVK